MSMLSATFGYLSSCTSGVSNYKVVNKNNLFNFMISTMEMLTDEQKETFIKNMKINMGMTFYSGLKNYIFTKMNNSPLLEFFT